MTGASALAGSSVMHTLGPSGTNLEMAAQHWFDRRGRQPDVRLHPTFCTLHLAAALGAEPAT